LGVPAAADAQTPRWGIAVSFSPSWTSGDSFKSLHSADDQDLSGTDLRIGFVRGRSARREWGLSFVRKTIGSDSRITVDGVEYKLDDDVRQTGFAFHGAPILGRVGENFQIGMLIAGGVGFLQGGAHASDGTPVRAEDVLRPFGRDFNAHPIFDVHVTAAYRLTPGLRVRVGGGFSYPGTTIVTIGMVYFHER
jgi:hypothetical protein